jgi:hypothetical protein
MEINSTNLEFFGTDNSKPLPDKNENLIIIISVLHLFFNLSENSFIIEQDRSIIDTDFL